MRSSTGSPRWSGVLPDGPGGQPLTEAALAFQAQWMWAHLRLEGAAAAAAKTEEWMRGQLWRDAQEEDRWHLGTHALCVDHAMQPTMRCDGCDGFLGARYCTVCVRTVRCVLCAARASCRGDAWDMVDRAGGLGAGGAAPASDGAELDGADVSGGGGGGSADGGGEEGCSSDSASDGGGGGVDAAIGGWRP